MKNDPFLENATQIQEMSMFVLRYAQTENQFRIHIVYAR